MSAIAYLLFPDRSVVVSAKLYFYGDFANEEVGKKIVDEIVMQYNSADGKIVYKGVEFSVKFEIDFEVVDTLKVPEMIVKNHSNHNNFIRIEQENVAERSFMGYGLGSNSGHWLITDNLGESTTAAHEFGHSLGLDHPLEFDLRGLQTPPPIMAPRGTFVDAKYQWNPTVEAAAFGGTLKPIYRRVCKDEISQIFHGKVFSETGTLNLGVQSNIIFDKVGNPLSWLA